MRTQKFDYVIKKYVMERTEIRIKDVPVHQYSLQHD